MTARRFGIGSIRNLFYTDMMQINTPCLLVIACIYLFATSLISLSILTNSKQSQLDGQEDEIVKRVTEIERLISQQHPRQPQLSRSTVIDDVDLSVVAAEAVTQEHNRRRRGQPQTSLDSGLLVGSSVAADQSLHVQQIEEEEEAAAEEEEEQTQDQEKDQGEQDDEINKHDSVQQTEEQEQEEGDDFFLTLQRGQHELAGDGGNEYVEAEEDDEEPGEEAETSVVDGTGNSDAGPLPLHAPGCPAPKTCSFPSEMFVSYVPGGGFNNQRQSLERAFQVCLLLGRSLVVRDIYIDPKHNPNCLYSGQFLSADAFFDLNHLRQSGVSVYTQSEFKRIRPNIYQSPKLLKGIFNHAEVWTDYVPCDDGDGEPVLDILGERPLPVDTLYPIVDRLSCMPDKFLEIGLIGMNRFWRTQRRTRELAAAAVQFAPEIRQLARRAIQQLGGLGRFSCVHFRQGDKLMVSPGEYNYSAAEAAKAVAKRIRNMSQQQQHQRSVKLKRKQLAVADADELVYVATDASERELLPFQVEFRQNLLSAYNLPVLKNHTFSTNDYLGCVEVEICTAARLFFASSSTFSASILNQRHAVSGITRWEVDRSSNFNLKLITLEDRQLEQKQQETAKKRKKKPARSSKKPLNDGM